MRKITIALMLMFLIPGLANAGYLGSWKIDDKLTVVADTHLASTAAVTDADSVPVYRVYEDSDIETAILTGSMAKHDDANTTGHYKVELTLSAANFEKGKSYHILITAAVSSVTGAISHNFQIEAEVDSNTVSPNVTFANTTIGSVNALGAQAKLDVNTEADTALSDYDPPTKTEMDAGHTLINNNIGTAQNDLDTITGSDGVTLATAQGLYAPSTASALVAHDDKIASRVTATRMGYLTGDSYARLGVPEYSTISSDIANIAGSTFNPLTDSVVLSGTQTYYAPATAAALVTHNNFLGTVEDHIINTGNADWTGAGASAASIATAVDTLLTSNHDAGSWAAGALAATDVWTYSQRGLTENVTVGTNNDKTDYSLLNNTIGTASVCGNMRGTDSAFTAASGVTLSNLVTSNGIAINGLNDLSQSQTYSQCYSAITVYDPPTNTENLAAHAITDGIINSVKAKTDNLPASPAAVGSQMGLTDSAIESNWKYNISDSFLYTQAAGKLNLTRP